MMPDREHTQAALAVAYAESGFSVHPVSPDKRPLTPQAFKDATGDPASVRAWWRQWPNALIGIPTGAASGLWVLDIDAPHGLICVPDLLNLTDAASLDELSPAISATPRGGRHVYFKTPSAPPICSRASDIGPGLDTRGEGGFIIAPGNRLPDGRRYELVGRSRDIREAASAPAELVYLAAFKASERLAMASDPDLCRDLRSASPDEWQSIINVHRQLSTSRAQRWVQSCEPSPTAMRRQAIDDLSQEATSLASLTDGRRIALFHAACRLAKYAAHNVLGADEIAQSLTTASCANGAVAKHGAAWARETVLRGLKFGQNDALPPLARRYREFA